MHKHGGDHRCDSPFTAPDEAENAGGNAGSGRIPDGGTPPPVYIRRRHWSRYSQFFTPFTLEYPPVDNSLAERLDRIIVISSRISGVLLLLIAFGALGWWLHGWLG